MIGPRSDVGGPTEAKSKSRKVFSRSDVRRRTAETDKKERKYLILEPPQKNRWQLKGGGETGVKYLQGLVGTWISFRSV